MLFVLLKWVFMQLLFVYENQQDVFVLGKFGIGLQYEWNMARPPTWSN